MQGSGHQDPPDQRGRAKTRRLDRRYGSGSCVNQRFFSTLNATRSKFLLAALAAVIAGPRAGATAGPAPSSRGTARLPKSGSPSGAKESGLDFVHFNGMSGERYYPEIMAPGVGLFDYDNDGDLDVYLVQGQMLGAKKTLKDATFPPAGPLGDRLFRNDLVVACRWHPDAALHRRHRRRAASPCTSYGMGVAAGDCDNDGFVDLYRTGLRGSVLLHNNGNGTFTDVTAKTGVGESRRLGRVGRRSSTTTATAGSISSSATICSTASPATWTVCR